MVELLRRSTAEHGALIIIRGDQLPCQLCFSGTMVRLMNCYKNANG
jgi:hypothetical protein